MVTTLRPRSSTDEEIQAFSDRLNFLLDSRGFTPKGKGRQVELAKTFDLTQKAVRKWVEGEGLPETVRQIQIAREFRCNFEWLALGTGPMDADPATQGHQAELARRMERADSGTVKLIELALMAESELEKTELSPSLRGLIGFVKQQVREAIAQ